MLAFRRVSLSGSVFNKSMTTKETNSLIAWVNSYKEVVNELNDGRPIKDLSELSDGIILSSILTRVDPDSFPPIQSIDNSSFTNRLQILTKLQASLTSLLPNLPPLNLSLLASTKPSNVAGAENEIIQLVKHVLIAAVKGSGGPGVVQGIGYLGEEVGAGLMLAITPVMNKLDNKNVDEFSIDNNKNNNNGDNSIIERSSDEDYYALLATHTALSKDKKTLEGVYQALLDDMRSLRAEHDDTIAELASLRDEASMVKSSASKVDITERAEESLRNELNKVREELQKSEDGLAECEAVNERQINVINDLNRKVEDLSSKSNEVSKLRDQLEENKHAVSKLQKTENVIEKYKQKLEDSANLRRQYKSLEEQNSELINLNSNLEATIKGLNVNKSLSDNYKNQLNELDLKFSNQSKEFKEIQYELSQLRASNTALEEERIKSNEHIDLLEEKLREIEVDRGVNNQVENLSKQTENNDSDKIANEDDLELALSSTNTTDLKLQIRRLMRELESIKHEKGGDPNQIVVLENLLADTQKVKERYEADWMSELTQKLDLSRKLEELTKGIEEGSREG